MTIEVVGVDGDDTLWFHERLYVDAQERLSKIIHRYVRDREWTTFLDDITIGNINVFGYGVKSFILSVLEASVRITQGQIKSSDILEIITVGKEMLSHDIELISGVDATLQALRHEYHLVLITKGDTSEQRNKMKSSRFITNFSSVEVVREKDIATYAQILKDLGKPPSRFVMIGNSIRSDINPVLRLGGWAIHVPGRLIWKHELAEPLVSSGRYLVARNFEGVPRLIEKIRVSPSSKHEEILP